MGGCVQVMTSRRDGTMRGLRMKSQLTFLLFAQTPSHRCLGNQSGNVIVTGTVNLLTIRFNVEIQNQGNILTLKWISKSAILWPQKPYSCLVR